MWNWLCICCIVGFKLVILNNFVIIFFFVWNLLLEMMLVVINVVCGVWIWEGWIVKVIVFVGKVVCWVEGIIFCEVIIWEMVVVVIFVICCVKFCGVEIILFDIVWDFILFELKFDVMKFCWGCCVVVIWWFRD